MNGSDEVADWFQLVRNCGAAAIAQLKTLDDINSRNDRGENLLHVAIAFSNVKTAIYLIERGIDVNAQSTEGTPLHYCGEHACVSVAKSILDNGGDLSITDAHGNTPLWTAVFNARGEYSLVEVMLERGCENLVRQKNKHGMSPLDFAEQIGDDRLARLLKEGEVGGGSSGEKKKKKRSG